MLNKYIDQTNLKPNATISDIDNLIIDTWNYDFYGICISSCWTKYVSESLKWINQYGIENFNQKPKWDFEINDWKKPQSLKKQSKVKIVTVIGFPLGNESIISKLESTQDALKNGADEIDMVFNIGMFLSNQYGYIKKEINTIKNACQNHILKVIIETGYFDNQQLKDVVCLLNQTNTDFIKTSTGFGPRGFSLSDLVVIKENIDSKKLIKAAGGIKDYETANNLVKLGVNRIGTSSGIKIIKKE